MEIRPGTFPLIFFGLAFLALQFWWISMTIRNGKKSLNKNKSKLDLKEDKLAQQRKILEKLLEK
tara:strand:- start:987 stop:1178 length:192 start_codon:yes stop_codon:yes gene_type:complete